MTKLADVVLFTCDCLISDQWTAIAITEAERYNWMYRITEGRGGSVIWPDVIFEAETLSIQKSHFFPGF